MDDSLSDVQQPKGKYCGACDSFKDDDGICKCVGIVIFKELSKDEVIEKWPMKKDSGK